MMRHGLVMLLAAAGMPGAVAGQSEEGVAETIAKFKEGDPGIQGWFKDAYGYAVFPSVGKGGIGIGGARGKGLVYERGTLVGKVTLTQVSVGLQLGGQSFSEAIFFKDKTAFDDFTRGNYEFDAASRPWHSRPGPRPTSATTRVSRSSRPRRVA